MVLIDLNEPPPEGNERLEAGIGVGYGDAGRGHGVHGLAGAVLAGFRQTAVRHAGVADDGVSSATAGRVPSRLGLSGRGMTAGWSAGAGLTGQARGPALGLTGRGHSLGGGGGRGECYDAAVHGRGQGNDNTAVGGDVGYGAGHGLGVGRGAGGSAGRGVGRGAGRAAGRGRGARGGRGLGNVQEAVVIGVRHGTGPSVGHGAGRGRRILGPWY